MPKHTSKKKRTKKKKGNKGSIVPSKPEDSLKEKLRKRKALLDSL